MKLKNLYNLTQQMQDKMKKGVKIDCFFFSLRFQCNVKV